MPEKNHFFVTKDYDVGTLSARGRKQIDTILQKLRLRTYGLTDLSVLQCQVFRVHLQVLSQKVRRRSKTYGFYFIQLRQPWFLGCAHVLAAQQDKRSAASSCDEASGQNRKYDMFSLLKG